MSWFPVLLVTHVALAVSLLLPSVVLPFVLRRSAGGSPGRVARLLMRLTGTGTLLIGAGLAITGAAMLLLLGPDLITQTWLLVALALYAVNLVVAAVISRPNLRRLVGVGASGSDIEWRRRARRQRWIAYGMAAGIGVIGFLMSTKPELW
jgi:hypothetical protein